MVLRYNCFGQLLLNDFPSLKDPSYGHVDELGRMIIHWTKENKDVDGKGFDKNHRESNGEYIQQVVLPKGVILCRYGNPNGQLTAPQGTPYEQLALPYDKETIAYHEYEVIADNVTVTCIVTKGRTYKMFDSPGGATQYLHPQSIRDEIADLKLKEVFEWKSM